MNDLAHNRHWLSRPPAPMHHKSISMCIFPLRISFHVCVIFAENDGQLGHETRFRMKVLGHSTVAEFKALIRSVWESRVRAVYVPSGRAPASSWTPVLWLIFWQCTIHSKKIER